MSENLNESTTPLLPTVSSRGHRIVLQHTRGAFKGLHQIIGHSDEFQGQAPPVTTEPFDITPDARKGIAGLSRVTPRFILYKEVTQAEGLGTFDRAQR